MTKKNQVYKCNVCGNIVGVLHSGAGELVCCGQPMELLEEKDRDEGLEKHVPVIREINNKVVVRVGEKEHPMEEKHYIEWVEVVFKNGKRVQKFLNFQNKPEVEFCSEGEVGAVRIHCNIHGLWRNS